MLQREETGVVRPESFTHGTAAQRRHWLSRGATRLQMLQATMAIVEKNNAPN